MRTRSCAKIVALHEARVLLLRYEDERPADPSRSSLLHYWVPPGGGVKEGETFEEAARRELEEETGIVTAEIGPCIWIRELHLLYKGELVLHHERYLVAWLREPIENLRNRTSEAIKAHRWWSVPEMAASDDTFLPRGLAELLAPVIEGRIPPEPLVIERPSGQPTGGDDSP
jgi:8-oxo-dGTP pyrophosphatase MutT (NUDIX family)